MARDVLVVHGYQEFMRACARAEKDTDRYVKAAFAGVGEAVRSDAAARFSRYDSRSAAGFRSKALQKGVLVYQSKRKTTGKRGQYGALQMRKGLLPARAAKTRQTMEAMEHALDQVCDRFEAGP